MMTAATRGSTSKDSESTKSTSIDQTTVKTQVTMTPKGVEHGRGDLPNPRLQARTVRHPSRDQGPDGFGSHIEGRDSEFRKGRIVDDHGRDLSGIEARCPR